MVILAIRLAVELFGVAAAAVVGASVPVAQPWPTVLAVAAPVALAVFWGLVAAPKAANPLPQRARNLVGSAALLLVAGLLAVVGQPAVGLVYGLVLVGDHALIIALDPRPVFERPAAVARH